MAITTRNLTDVLEDPTEDLPTVQQIAELFLRTSTTAFTNKTLNDISNFIYANGLHLKVTALEDINIGQPVKFTSYNLGQDEIQVNLADNTLGAAIGLAKENILSGNEFTIVCCGCLKGFDTTAYNDGETLYLGTNGTLTHTEPTIGIAQPIAFVIKSAGDANGALRVDASYPKQDADDVRFDSDGNSVYDVLSVATKNVSTMEDILTIEYTIYSTVNIKGYHLENDGGGGLFNWNSSMDKSNANGGTIIDPGVSLANQGTGIGVGCWIRSNIEYITPKMFGAIGDGLTNDATAIISSASAASSIGIILNGFGLTYAVHGGITINSDIIRNINFVEYSGSGGDGPVFTVNKTTGICKHENITVTGFSNAGAKIDAGLYSGVPTFIARGKCEYNNNGDKIQTTTTTDIDTTNTWIIPVVDESEFSANDEIWIGDGKFTILSTSLGQITLVNNGSEPTLLDGSRYKNPSGQFVTVDRNGQNGLTMGDGTAGWNIDIPNGAVTASNNAWFGIFHWANSYAGKQNIHGCIANDNGFIGIGLGYTNEGEISGNHCLRNGNNGLDSLRSKNSISMHDNECRLNGVDGIFVGGNSEIARVLNNIAMTNKRMGILMTGGSTAIYGAGCMGNDIRNNWWRSVTFTGIRSGSLENNKVGGTSAYDSIYIEGKNGLLNPSMTRIANNDFFENNVTANDIGGNLGGFTGGGADNGAVFLNGNNYFNRDSSIEIINLDSKYSHSDIPFFTITGGLSHTTTAGSPVSIEALFYWPYRQSKTDHRINLTEWLISATDQEDTSSSVDTATRTTGVEIENGATTNGKILSYPNLGSTSYNLTLSAAGTRYVHIKSGGFKRTIEITWT